MSAPKSLTSRLRFIRPSSTLHSQHNCRRCFATIASAEQWPQRTPLGGYYESILSSSLTPHPFVKKSDEPPKSADSAALSTPLLTQKPEDQKSKTPLNTSVSFDTSPPTPPPTTPEEKARIIFGSRLLGPAEQEDRLAIKKAQSTYVAGVLIPPRPEEPDNCCMSGCVNCVWDGYREDLEEWTTKKKEAEETLRAAAGSMDADGRGSRASRPIEATDKKIAKDMWEEDAFTSVPVGIREFMKIEKRLREKHEKEGTIGG